VSARGIDARVLADLLGDECCRHPADTEGVLRGALDSLGNELMTLYFLFYESKIFENEDFPGDEVLQMVRTMSRRATTLARLGIATEETDAPRG